MATFRLIAAAVSATVTFVVAAGCASRSGPRTDRLETPIGSAWASTQDRDHPLAGRIWDVRKNAFVTEQELQAAIEQARLLLLGEVHDNPDHHLLQARFVRAVTATGRRPSIAFEMLDETQQGAIDAIPKGEQHNPDAIRDAVRWDESGWPRFALYRPVFEAALDAALPVIAANLPRARIREASRGGLESLPAGIRGRIERQGPLSASVRADMRAEMAESHCGELPDSMLDPLILGQRARDAQLADAISRGATADGSILITGSGHARLDRGVASYLAPEELAKGTVVAIALQEVSSEKPEAEQYHPVQGDLSRFDFVVFTPGAEREDPCEKFREHMQHMKKHPAPEGAGDEGTPL
jgi:uncharacterized iron-regulated protein